MNEREIRALFDRSICFHPLLARMTGNVCAGLMLSQAIYWSGVLEKDPDRADGWFYKSQAGWEEELCIGRWEQETARKCLRRFAFWQEERRGSPAKLWFRLNFEKLAESVGQYVGKPHSRMRENHNLDCGKTSNKNVGKPQSLKGTENTSEIKADIKARAQTARPANPLTRKTPKLQPQQVTYAQTGELARAGEKMLRNGEVRGIGDLKERLKYVAARKGMEHYGDACSNAADIAMRRVEGTPLFSRGPA